MATITLTELLLAEAATPTVCTDPTRRSILQRFAACHTPLRGGRILSCRSCGIQIVVYNKCNHRGCPQCARASQYSWQSSMQQHLLPVAHFHLVFSGPDSLSAAWLRRPKAVIDALFAAANTAIQRHSTRGGLRFGALVVFHSHGVGMSYKPHLHCMLTAGGLDAEHHWQPCRHLDQAQLRQQFHREALTELGKRLEANQIAPLHRQPAKRWRLYAVLHPDSPQALISYFARSLRGLLIDPRQPLVLDEDIVQFPSFHCGRQRTTTLTRREFFTRYFAHIPPKATVTVRHYGLYATRSAAALKELSLSLTQLPSRDEPPPQAAKPTQLCPICHGNLQLTLIFTPDHIPQLLRPSLPARASPPATAADIHSHRISA